MRGAEAHTARCLDDRAHSAMLRRRHVAMSTSNDTCDGPWVLLPRCATRIIGRTSAVTTTTMRAARSKAYSDCDDEC